MHHSAMTDTADLEGMFEARSAEGSPILGSLLQIKGVRHEYPRVRRAAAAATVLTDVDLDIAAGEFVSIVGPSGCGKSTLLRFISGLAAPTAGEITIGGRTVTDVRRDVGFIFQQDALLPWRTVQQNVQLGLKFRKVPRAEARQQAAEWLSRFGLGTKGPMYPHQLSGGQRKRASIAATLVNRPKLLLMDEPFSALDIQTRDLIESDILRAWADSGQRQTIVMVTHDLEEAIAMSDRVVVMSRGPGRVISDYRVDLERPRDIFEIRSTEGFRKFYELIWEDLRVEVKGAVAAEMTANLEADR
jgi:NitT/TauT family transport system ATP-binding protein